MSKAFHPYLKAENTVNNIYHCTHVRLLMGHALYGDDCLVQTSLVGMYTQEIRGAPDFVREEISPLLSSALSSAPCTPRLHRQSKTNMHPPLQYNRFDSNCECVSGTPVAMVCAPRPVSDGWNLPLFSSLSSLSLRVSSFLIV